MMMKIKSLTYTVKETSKDERYTTSYASDDEAKNGVDITNTLVAEEPAPEEDDDTPDKDTGSKQTKDDHKGDDTTVKQTEVKTKNTKNDNTKKQATKKAETKATASQSAAIKTGDETPIAFYVVIAIAACGALIALKRKMKGEER